MAQYKKRKIKSIDELTQDLKGDINPYVKEFEESLKKVLKNKKQKEEDDQKSKDSPDC